jgi:hypothetical protein
MLPPDRQRPPAQDDPFPVAHTQFFQCVAKVAFGHDDVGGIGLALLLRERGLIDGYRLS